MGQEKDKTFKLISNEYLLEFLNMLEIGIEFDVLDDSEIEVLTGEQISIEPSLYRPDFIVRIGDFILMLEFQSTYIGIRDIKRFKVYISNFDLKVNVNNLNIIFAVISTAQNSKIAEYCINEWNCFNFPLISLLNINEREIISNIKEKINKHEDFSNKELVELALTPIMVNGRENIICQFKETSDLMNLLTFPNDEIKESVYGIALMLANMYFEKDDPMRKKIEGGFMMKIDCVQEAIDEAIDESIERGREQGIGQGQVLMIKNLVDDGAITVECAVTKLLGLDCKLEEISEITGLSISEIESFKN